VIQDAYKKNTPESPLVGHITRDSTAIEARERYPETTEQAAARQEKHPRQRSQEKQQRPDAILTRVQTAQLMWRTDRFPFYVC